MLVHHPDVAHYMWRAFTELGHHVAFATEKLTLDMGFKYSSMKGEDNKFEVVDQLFEPSKLYPDMSEIYLHNNIENISEYEIIWSMLPEITSLSKYGINTWFDGQMQVYLREKRFAALPGIKSANHPNAWELNQFHFVPNWVDKQPDLIEKKYITQMITECDLVSTTKELKALRDQGYPVKIHGGKKCPDGFIRDINILPYTSMLVHDKQFGVNCYAVCKALDMGIPVYMSKQTRDMIGFGDLPDDCFLFAHEHTIMEAFELSKLMNNADIQRTYRAIYTLDRTKKAIQTII